MKYLAKIIGTLCLIPVLDAIAEGPEIVEEVVVIKLSPGASPEEAYSEIRKQARHACTTRAIEPHRHLRYEAACKRQFVADAVVAFDRPELTALHRERVGGQTAQLAEIGKN